MPINQLNLLLSLHFCQDKFKLFLLCKDSNMNLFSKIRDYLLFRRLTSQYLLSQLGDATFVEQAITTKKLHVWMDLSGAIDFMAYISPGKILHIQGDPNVLLANPLANLLEELKVHQILGINGPSDLVSKVLLEYKSHFNPPRIKMFNDLIYQLKLPTSELFYNGPGVPRQLTRHDFDDWHHLYNEYLKELGLNSSASKEERKARFQVEVDRNWHWGTFLEHGELVSIGAYNAKNIESGQIGGVFTPPSFRGKGLAMGPMIELIRAASSETQMKELILFTDPPTSAPGRLYTKLGFKPVDHYSMVVFE